VQSYHWKVKVPSVVNTPVEVARPSPTCGPSGDEKTCGGSVGHGD
jgi:hypothetical protein